MLKIMNNDFKNKNIINIINNINLRKSYLKEDIHLYFNIKSSDGINFISENTDNLSIFFCGCNNNQNNNNNYQFVTINSLNPNNYKYNFLKISEKRFDEIKNKLIKYVDNYNYKKDGYILVFLNNSEGWFKNNLKSDDFLNSIDTLINDIRMYTDREIIFRLHPKDLNNINIIDYFKNKQIIIDEKNLYDSIEDCYCCFIQNSKLIIDLVNSGKPIFNLNFYNVNYFNNIFINIKDIENLDNIIVPNRIKFLKYYYHFIFFKYELFNENSFVNILKNYNIII